MAKTELKVAHRIKRFALLLAVSTLNASAGAETFNWTVDTANSNVQTTLTASIGSFSASDTKTSAVAGTFAGTLGLPAFDFANILINNANLGYTTNPTFTLSYGFFGGATVTSNGLGFALPGPNNLGYAPTTPSPVALNGAFNQTGTGVEGRGTLSYSGYGIAGGAIGTGSVNLLDLSPIPGVFAGTVTQVGSVVRLTLPLALDQSMTDDSGRTFRAQVAGTVVANATTTAGGWKVDAGGSFATAANFSSGVVPTSAGAFDTAVFGNVITAPRTIALSAGQAPRIIISSAIPYTFTGTVNNSSGTDVSIIDVRNGTGHRIGTVLTNRPITVAAGAQLTVDSVGGFNLRKLGAGTLRVENGNVSAFQPTEGVIQIGTQLNVSETIAFGTGGQVDVANGTLAILASGANQAARLAIVQQELREGRNGGSWNGPGIVSSTLGVGGAVGYKVIGTSIATINVRRTLAGDADLDLDVDFDDLLALARNYNATTSWPGGDFDYSGVVNFDDLLALAKNYNRTAAASATFDVAALSSEVAADWALAQALVPEPTLVGVVGALGLAGVRRRLRSIER